MTDKYILNLYKAKLHSLWQGSKSIQLQVYQWEVIIALEDNIFYYLKNYWHSKQRDQHNYGFRESLRYALSYRSSTTATYLMKSQKWHIWKVLLYATLPLPCEGTEVVSELSNSRKYKTKIIVLMDKSWSLFSWVSKYIRSESLSQTEYCVLSQLF